MSSNSSSFVYKYRPVICEKQAIYSPIQLVCLKSSCDRTLLTRWFTTVASILSIANNEFELLLHRFSSVSSLNFKFVVNKESKCTTTLSIQLGNETYDNVKIPVIVGSQLWFMINADDDDNDDRDNVQMDDDQKQSQITQSSATIDIFSYRKWKQERIEQPKDVMCPICCFTDYIPLCCFFIDQKMFRLPTLASVDCRKIHIRRPGNILNVFVSGNVRIGEDNDETNVLKPLMCVKQDILKMRDSISNFSFYTVGKIFAKRLELALAHIVSLKQEASANLKRSNKVLAILNRMNKDFSFGNITIAISRSTQFASTEMGGQLNETTTQTTNDYHNNSNNQIRKSDIESRKGFIKDSSRYIHTPVNHPILAMFAPLHCVKLASVDLKTKSHQILQSASCAYFDKIHTVDNKNVGCHLEILPGVKFVQINESEFIRHNYANTTYDKRDDDDDTIDVDDDINIDGNDHYDKVEINSLAKLKHCFKAACNNHLNIGNKCIVYFPNISHEILPMSIEAIEEIIREHEYPISLYYWPKKNVCIVYNSNGDIADERFSLTPLTRECLLHEFPDRWSKRLSPKISGNVPIFGVLGHQFMFLNHDSTTKLVPGFAGIRHALGLPVSCKVPSNIPRGRYLLYPQGDLENHDSIVCSSQKLMVVIAAFRSHGVEDGIIVNKEARDKGFGLVLNECMQAQFMVTCSGPRFIIAVPNSQTNSLDIVFERDTELLRKSSLNVTVKLPERLRHKHVEQNEFLCDVLGISNYNSYCIDIKVMSYQSASRIFYNRYYNVGNVSQDYRLLFESITIRTAGKPQNCNLFICLNFSELRPLELGDKYSTIDGQKATVVSILPAVDMPFIGGKGEYPPIPDVILNISSSKRQTLGLNLSGVCSSAKLSDPDYVDLNAFRGDASVKHSTDLQRLLFNCEQSGIIGRVPLFDGRTAYFMGYGDLYCLTLFRYEQDGSKTVFYTHWDEENRTPNGDFQEKGRGKKGGSKYSQTETICLLNQGGPPAYQKQLLQSGEPRTNFNRNTSIFPQSFISAVMSCNIHNLDLKPIMRKD